jgi:uncharacterized protein YkwD
MKVLDLYRPMAMFVRIGARALGSLFLIAFVSSSIASAQSVTPRPVARLISGSASESVPRRLIGTGDVLVSNAAVSASPSIAEATTPEQRAFKATNELRLRNGLAPLDWDPELCVIARRHSRNMSVLGFFSHQTPEGLRLRDRARLAGIRYRVIAENIAYNQGFEDPGAFAVERWAISEGHRANLLSTEFRASAVGSFVASDGTVFLTQLFILR